MAQNTTLLIADISGYTEFLTKTELVHSSHIVNELLEAILAANKDAFSLCEVEGDALLLYRKGDPPDPDTLARHCVGMFEGFHRQLKIIERDSICQCGACRTASNLSLKFVVHQGPVQEIKVSQFTKLSGIDMVVVHRLLKNQVPSHEYILVTNRCIDATTLAGAGSDLVWESSADEYPAIGNVQYAYAPLERVRRAIPQPPRPQSPVTELGNDTVAVEIDAPMTQVYQLVIDLDQRTRWMSGEERVDRPALTERVGLRHVCIFRGLTLEWTTVKSEVMEDSITYVEEGRIVELGLAARASYVLRRLAPAKTSLRFHLKWLGESPAPAEVTAQVMADLKLSLEAVKAICEGTQPADAK